MKAKTIAFGVCAILSLFLIAGMVSALSISSPGVLTSLNNQTTLTVTNTHNVSQDISLSISDNETGLVFAVSPSLISNLENGTSRDVTIYLSEISQNLRFGEYKSTLTATGDSTSASREINFVKGFCKEGEKGSSLSIDRVRVRSDGDKDYTWKLLDTVTVEVIVENLGDEDIRDVMVELGLFDSRGRNIADDLIFSSRGKEEINFREIREGKDEKAKFEFRVPADFKDGDYKLAVKVYSDKLGESSECSDTSLDLSEDYYTEISVEREDDEGYFIAFDNVKLSESTVTCGDTVTLSFDVYNIGDEDLEGRFKVNVIGASLNLNVYEEIIRDLDQGDRASFEFTFKVPEGVDEIKHKISFWADYGYDDGGYDYTSERTQAIDLEVIGCEPKITSLATVTAELISEEVKAGKELVIKATIVNPNSESISYVIGANNYNTWAELVSISNQILTVGAGESAEVTFTFNINKDASESESFTIEVLSGELSASREVSVSIDNSSLLNMIKGNSLILIIGAINIVLILLIILVAVKMSRG